MTVRITRPRCPVTRSSPDPRPWVYPPPDNGRRAILSRKVADSEDAAARARREAEEHARGRESVEQRLAREAEERSTWEKLAEESETARAEVAARLTAVQAAANGLPNPRPKNSWNVRPSRLWSRGLRRAAKKSIYPHY